MNSPDERAPLSPFDRRIADAARSLKESAPEGMLEAIRARADERAGGRADLEDAITTMARVIAARSITEPAPLSLLDIRIAAAARDLEERAPAGAYAAIRARARSSRLRAPLIVLRDVVAPITALAAALIVGVTLLVRAPTADAATPRGLLSATALADSRLAEEQFEKEAADLARRVAAESAAEPVANDDASSQLDARISEELAAIDRALDECRDALACSPAHEMLRDRLIDLGAERVDLLRTLADAGAQAPESGPRG